MPAACLAALIAAISSLPAHGKPVARALSAPTHPISAPALPTSDPLRFTEEEVALAVDQLKRPGAPLNAEAAANPFHEAQHLAQALGVHTHWAQDLPELPPPHSIIIAGESLLPQQMEKLEQWVEAGGRLVADRSATASEEELARWTGTAHAPEPSGWPVHPGNITAWIRSIVSLPATLHSAPTCNSLRIESTRNAAPETRGHSRNHYRVCGFESRTRLTTTRNFSWGLRDEQGGIQALRVQVGQGSVTLINSRPFDMHTLFAGDDALLLAAAAQLRRGDTVYFLSKSGDAGLLSLIRNGAPVVVMTLALVGCWLWRLAVRFGPLVPAPRSALGILAHAVPNTNIVRWRT